MGKTRNTRPYKARPEAFVEHHDHRNGECDLPPLKDFLKHHYWRVNSRKNGRDPLRCEWWPDWTKVHDTRCSCGLCRDPWFSNWRQRWEEKKHPTDPEEY